MNLKGYPKRLYQAVVVALVSTGVAWASASATEGDDASGCQALLRVRNLTLLGAELRTLEDSSTQYCSVRGLITPGIHYHAQLPLPGNWNERFLKRGDGGMDGDLDFADHRVAEGYAVANSNMGHDSGSEPGSWFGWNNRQSEIDYGYRAVHLTVNAARTLIEAYYGKAPRYSYFEGCSTGGREGLMEAQRFPYDFDGIVAGDPVHYLQQNQIAHTWNMQNLYKNDFSGMLAYDTDGDGKFDSLTKINMLREAVLAKCDALDGIRDGVIDHPPSCPFDPDADLAGKMCPGDVNADECYTKAQLETIKNFYRGPHDSRGKRVYWGKAYGWEHEWARRYIPHPGNDFKPHYLRSYLDYVNFLFYEKDPGIPPPDFGDLSYKLERKKNPPEFAWWEFDIDDFTGGKSTLMASIINADEPDLTRFLIQNNGKFILYHGWCDGGPPPGSSLAYYEEMVDATFGGDLDAALEHMRLFMAPGMNHCRGGPGPNSWDKLAPLVAWVEEGQAPDFVVATHSTDGKVDNERPICAYPQRAVYKGPAGGQNDPANWVARNFTCR